MTPQEVLSAAKQGNPQAIAALMNRNLKPKGITAKAKLTDGCLHIMLEGVTVPNQAEIVPYVTNGIKGLGVMMVKQLALYGRMTGENLPAWSDRVELAEAPPQPVAKGARIEVVPTSLQPEKAAKGSSSNTIGLAAVGVIVAFIGLSLVQNIWSRSQPSALGKKFEESTKRIEDWSEKASKNSGNQETATASTKALSSSQIGLTDEMGYKIEIDIPDNPVCHQNTVQVSMSVFENCLTNGLTIVQASNTIGYEGILVSQSGDTEIRKWHRGADNEQIIFGTFRNGKLVSKSQVGLQ